MAEVIVQVERERGCGFRKPGASGVGIYLTGPELVLPCGRLPFPLTVCPCCSGGIKPSRSWTWIEPSLLFADAPACAMDKIRPHLACLRGCPMSQHAVPSGRHGLLWIGGKFYKTPQDFKREADMMGLSRKLGAVPRGFVLGETCVFLAHREAVPARDEDGDPCLEPGIFTAFWPTGVDLVVADAGDVPETAWRMAERLEAEADLDPEDGAVRIVQVIPEEQTEMKEEEAANE